MKLNIKQPTSFVRLLLLVSSLSFFSLSAHALPLRDLSKVNTTSDEKCEDPDDPEDPPEKPDT